MKGYFVTGIGTDVGKTIVSAILLKALNADYWKPIQSGDLDNSDSNKIKNLLKDTQVVIYPEVYKLSKPLSPHASANIDNITININAIADNLPKTENCLIVEGAGGLIVPLNETDTILDLIKLINFPVILVSKNYLGSINHTLLSVEVLNNRSIPIAGILFNGEKIDSTETIILKKTGLKCLGRVPYTTDLNYSFIEEHSKLIMKEFHE